MYWIFTEYLILSVTSVQRSYVLVAPMVKKSACNSGDTCSFFGLGRSPGEANGYPLQYSCLENPMNRGAWRLQIVGHDWASGENSARNPGTSVSVPPLIVPDKMSLTTSIFLSIGFPGSSAGKKSAYNAGDLVLWNRTYTFLEKV